MAVSARSSSFVLSTPTGKVRIVNLTREDSLRFSHLWIGQKEYAFLSDGTLLWNGSERKIESSQPKVTVLAYSGDILSR